MRRALILLALCACSRAQTPAPAASATVMIGPPTPSASAAPAAPSVCEVSKVETIDDGDGKPDQWETMVLENVRVLASEKDAFVTWTRRAEVKTGDTYQVPKGAVRRGATSWKQVSLPVMSYACATYGVIAPNTLDYPFVAWGVVNTHAFEQWKELPSVKDTKEYPPPYSESDRSASTPKQTVSTFVASRDIAFASIWQTPCESSCNCERPSTAALWIYGLDGKFKKKVADRSADERAEPVPALAMNARVGLAAFRAKSALHLVWLDETGMPIGAPTKFADGDVGAPAVAMQGDDAIVVWAERAAKTEPYRLRRMKLASRATSADPVTIPTQGSAFAPAVLADATDVLLAWMEGDAANRTGEIHLARNDAPSAVVSGDETNARDPELSGTLANPTLIWQTFTKALPAGVIRVADVKCP